MVSRFVVVCGGRLNPKICKYRYCVLKVKPILIFHIKYLSQNHSHFVIEDFPIIITILRFMWIITRHSELILIGTFTICVHYIEYSHIFRTHFADMDSSIILVYVVHLGISHEGTVFFFFLGSTIGRFILLSRFCIGHYLIKCDKCEYMIVHYVRLVFFDGDDSVIYFFINLC